MSDEMTASVTKWTRTVERLQSGDWLATLTVEVAGQAAGTVSKLVTTAAAAFGWLHHCGEAETERIAAEYRATGEPSVRAYAEVEAPESRVGIAWL